MTNTAIHQHQSQQQSSSPQHSHHVNSNNHQKKDTSWQYMTRTIAHYERLEQIGLGTYGQVYRAKCLDTQQIVAMKKMRLLSSSINKARHSRFIQLFSSGCSHLDHRALGTCPNMAPPSRCWLLPKSDEILIIMSPDI